MEYNKCGTCEAKDGKAGVLINGDCQNCYDTKKEDKIVIHLNLIRTDLELSKTISIIKENK